MLPHENSHLEYYREVVEDESGSDTIGDGVGQRHSHNDHKAAAIQKFQLDDK
jgi:hypothetical protein